MQKELARVALLENIYAGKPIAGLPVGPLSLGSALTKPEKIADVLLLDPNNLGMKETLRRLKEFRPHVVGLTLRHSPVLEKNFRLLRRVKQELKGVKIVLGGPSIAGNKPEVAKYILHAEADAAFAGEAEETFREYVKQRGTAKADGNRLNESKLEGIHYFERIPKGMRFRFSPEVPHLSAEKMNGMELDYELVRPIVEGHNLEVFDMVTSRGCPGNCIFCSKPHGSEWRAWTAEKVVQELEKITAAFPQIKMVDFLDDSFLLSRKRALKIARKIRKKGLQKKLGFHVQASVHSLMKDGKPDAELLDALENMNVVHMNVGTDSFDDKELKKFGKGPYAARNAFELTEELKKRGIDVKHYLLLSHRATTPERLFNTCANALRIGENVGTNLFTYPFNGVPARQGLKHDAVIWMHIPPTKRMLGMFSKETLVNLVVHVPLILKPRDPLVFKALSNVSQLNLEQFGSALPLTTITELYNCALKEITELKQKQGARAASRAKRLQRLVGWIKKRAEEEPHLARVRDAIDPDRTGANKIPAILISHSKKGNAGLK